MNNPLSPTENHRLAQMSRPASEYLVRLPRRLQRVEPILNGQANLPAPDVESAFSNRPTSTAAAEQSLQHWQSALQSAVQQLLVQLQQLRQALPQLVAELAGILWEETVGMREPIPAEVWQRRLQEITSQLGRSDGITLALHPADKQWWLTQAPEELKKAVAGWNLVADPRLQRGECRAECGELTAWWRWMERVAAIHQTLVARMDTDALEPSTTS